MEAVLEQVMESQIVPEDLAPAVATALFRGIAAALALARRTTAANDITGATAVAGNQRPFRQQQQQQQH